MSCGEPRHDDRDRRRREFAKSLLRVPWAMSMFGVRQATRWLDPRGTWDDSTAQMDEVSHDLERKLDEPISSVYRTGRQLQDGMVDTLFALARGSWAVSDRAMRRAWRAIDQSWGRDRPTPGGMG